MLKTGEVIMVAHVVVCNHWYCVMFGNRVVAKFREKADANIYCIWCIGHHNVQSARLASGLVV